MQGETSRKPILIPAHRLPGQLVDCGWCGTSVASPSAEWCSATCRNRGLAGHSRAEQGPCPTCVILSVRDPATTLARFRSNETSPRMQQV